MRSVEVEKEKVERQRTEVENALTQAKEEVAILTSRVHELEGLLTKRDFEKEKYVERETGREKLLGVLEDKSRKL